jgi:3-hydroxyacyl-CoA dehydrogenase
VGVEAAIDLMIGGQPISAERAKAVNLVDLVVPDAALLDEAVAYAERLVAEGAPLRRARDLKVASSVDETRAATAAYRQRNPRRFVGFKAPQNILLAIEAAAELPFADGLDREHELFQELLTSEESAAQRHLFFAERAVAKIPDLDPGVAPRPIAAAAVVGAGTMGTGIAIALLAAGLSVTLIDQNAAALERAAGRIEQTIRGLAAKGRISPTAADQQVAALATASELRAVAGADLVIEAVFERLELKQAVFAELDKVAKAGAILASNTSFLDLNAIAAATARPQEVVGLHFFAPANVMRLLEVVRGDRTSGAVVATAMALGRRLGKVAVLSGVCDGFIANRLMARRGEAADRLVLQGAMPWDIDRAMTAYGFPMGVFQMLDLVGLDVVGWDREHSAGRTVQEILCEAGHWGQKTGAGYYDYSASEPTPSAAAVEAVRTIRARAGLPQRTFADEEIVNHLLDPVVNEGAKLLDEGVALRASDIDMALVAGYGWPVWRGGPMFWGDTVGLAAVLTRLRARVAAGEPISISPLLERMAAEDRRFVRD